MINLSNLTYQELARFVTETLNEPKFRAKQIFGWIYGGPTKDGSFRSGAQSFDEMNNLPKTLREKLTAQAFLTSLDVLRTQVSKLDGTRKFLFRLADGNAIESVFMRYKFGNSICVSSQAGCRMGCRFCASTIGGLKRNLTPGEIAGQILAAQRETGQRISHVVVMGTGEPFDNYENLAKFLHIIHDPNGLNLGMRNITVSTCGLVPMIARFAEDFPQVNLAISLHAVSNEMRDEIMPVNKAYPMETLLSACRDYTQKTARRVTFEYPIRFSCSTLFTLYSFIRKLSMYSVALFVPFCWSNNLAIKSSWYSFRYRPSWCFSRAFDAASLNTSKPFSRSPPRSNPSTF